MKGGGAKFAVVAVLLVFVVVGCAVLLTRTGGGDEAGGGGAEAAGTITFQEFQSVPLQSTQTQVEQRFGAPVDKSQLSEYGISPDDPTTAACIYYRAETREFGEVFEFCFEGGRLTNKNTL